MANTVPAPVQDAMVDRPLLRITRAWIEYFNRLSGTGGAIFTKPSCTAYLSAAGQSIPNVTYTAITFDSEEHDNSSMHSTATNTDRIVIPESGIYSFSYWLHWADPGGACFLGSWVTLNETSPVTPCLNSEINTAGAASPVLRVAQSRTKELAAGDILRLIVLQDSGGAVSIVGTEDETGFSCFKVSA